MNLARQPRTGVEGAMVAIRLGLAPILVPPRQKKPVIKGWTELRLTRDDLPRYFSRNENCGVLNGAPSGGLLDVDLDAPEALAACGAFLPRTNLVFGRPSKPRAHREYRVQGDPPRTAQFRDTDGTMLVELRSSGSQTLWPGSTHPDGELNCLESLGEPMLVDARDLAAAVARVAACALLARHWPTEPGSRHAIANAVAGYLLRGGLDQDVVDAIVIQAAKAAGDEEWRQRAADVRTTAKVQAAWRPTTGGPTLGTLLGEPVVAKLRDCLGLQSRPRDEDWSSQSFGSSSTRPNRPAPEAFHGLAGDVVRTIEPHSEADPVAILVQLLVAFGNVIGRRAHFTVEADEHYPNLFAVLVGETAKARKGTSWSHVKKALSEIDPAWAMNRVMSGLSTGEGLMYAVRDTESWQRQFSQKDSDSRDKRLLAFESEFASALRVMEREGNTLSAVIRTAWDSGNLQTLTKNSPMSTTGAHISIVGHVTEDEVRRYLTRTEAGNGFANRFLWVCVRRSKCLPEGGHLTDTETQPLVERLRKAVEFARSVEHLTLDNEARLIWHKVYPVLSEGKPGLLGAVIARAEAQALRLASLYALLDSSDVIKREHLLAAIALWDYCEASARYIYGGTLGDPVSDELLERLRAAPGGLTRTDIRDMFARNQRGNQIERALRLLLEKRLAHVERDEDTGGRPAERWHAITPGTTKTTETTKGAGLRSSRSFMSYLDLAKGAVEPDLSEPAR
jgi:hypothetical protein